MAYTPKNLQIFTAAFAGALAGMGLSDRIISDTNALSYAGLATVAGAWAQAVDTAWTLARGATLLDVEAVQSASAAYWQNRSPNADTSNTNPVTFAVPALALLAPITAGESYYASQGITPPAIPGGFPAGGGNFAATLALLQVVPTGALNNGVSYYVGTLETYFSLDAQSTATVDGITVVAAQAGGRWLRNLTYGNPNWLMVNNWFINATTGNDENDGQSAGTALQTHAELTRRWANGIIKPTATVSSNKVCTVNIMTSLPSSDPVVPRCVLGQSVILWYLGRAETVLYSGSFTAITAKNAATNTPLGLTDTGIGSWTTYLGKRWRINSGARLNTMGWVAKDLGANACRSSESTVPGNMNPSFSTAPTLFNATAQAPQVGDTYNIEQLVTVSMGPVNPSVVEAGTGSERIVIGEIAFRALGGNGISFSSVGNGAQSCVVYSCDFQGFVQWEGGNTNATFTNDHFGQGISVYSSTDFQGGLFDTSVAFAIGMEVFTGGLVGLTQAVMFQGVGMRGTGICITDACVFDSAVTSGNPGGHGLSIGKNRNIFSNTNTVAWASILTRLWGSGNAGTGVYVNANGSMVYASGVIAGITLTGTGGDFRLNNNTTANVWDQTANAGAGGFLAPRNTTWANLAATVATTGFGGYAQDIPSGARIAAAN